MDQFWLVVEGLAASAYLLDHLPQGVKDPVAQVVLPQMIPEMFHRVEFGAVGRQGQQLHVWGDAQSQRPVPASSIEQQQAVLVGEASRGVRQKERHGLGVHPGQDQRTEFSVQGTDRRQAVDKLAHNLVTDDRSQGQRGPATALVAEAAEASLVLEQKAHGHPGRSLP